MKPLICYMGQGKLKKITESPFLNASEKESHNIFDNFY